ncbi:hypothetical protein AMTR_s00128p00100840 [Amborella trichopoda]|uniref:Peptidase S9 prolyl oligopeptidase catalytic domain-containing protein n=1 Tax=Amborella trichopoda TaxID=13333 RepID=W1NMR2_AMBTC|nr:hypothetical protein AMTR_s00128p00100840 [Amborella trichopoda]
MELKVLELTTIWCSSSLDSLHFTPYLRCSSSLDSLHFTPYLSLPKIIEFPTEVQGQKAYAYFYPPFNHLYKATPGEKTPLLLESHGGPTSESYGTLDLSIQYWTSRGWAFIDVNYGGSTGSIEKDSWATGALLMSMTVAVVHDSCRKADGERLCTTGRLARGYTTLAALAFSRTFKAGSSLYGVVDLSLLKESKFESHYLDNLLGGEKNFYDRSPINFVERFYFRVILL